MASESSQTEQVALADLDDSMVISAYTGFHQKYNKMEEMTCKWLRHNFKGTKTIVERGGQNITTPIEKLEVGDTLLQLFSFPESLKKLTLVNDKLIQELQKRGFSRFKVTRTAKAGNATQDKKQQDIQKAEELVNKVKESNQVRNGASKAVEDLIDNTRSGKTDIADINNYVENIVTSAASEAVSVIASLKQSDQTYAHCVDVGAIFQVVYKEHLTRQGKPMSQEEEKEITLGAFMHDIGKAKIPKEILDSTVRFERDSHEMQLMQSHPVFGAEILTEMGMSDTIINMAHYHHVKMDTSMKSSYPTGVNFDDVIKETRFIAIVDIYQALIGRRSYKKSWAPPAAVKFIEQLSGIEYDLDIWDEFVTIMGNYPVGSLVELNDGSIAFVVQRHDSDPSKPKVVPVRNAKGEDITHHTLINLEVEKDIVIAKDLDNYDVFGEASFDIFTSIQIT